MWGTATRGVHIYGDHSSLNNPISPVRRPRVMAPLATVAASSEVVAHGSAASASVVSAPPAGEAAEDELLRVLLQGKLSCPLLERAPFGQEFSGVGRNSILTLPATFWPLLRSPWRVMEALRKLGHVVGTDASQELLLYTSQQLHACLQDLRMELFMPATQTCPNPPMVSAALRLLSSLPQLSELGKQLRSVLMEALPYMDAFIELEPLALVSSITDPVQVPGVLISGIQRRVRPALEFVIQLHEALEIPQLPQASARAAAILGRSHGLEVSLMSLKTTDGPCSGPAGPRLL